MKNNGKKGLKYLIIGILSISCLFNSLVFPVHADKPVNSIDFSWGLSTYSVSYDKTWEGVPVTMNYTGSYVDEYVRQECVDNKTGGYWINKIIYTTHHAKYSHFSNHTRIGYMNLDITLSVYKVDIRIGDAGRVIWMAVRSGNLDLEQYILGESFYMDYYEEYHQNITTQYYKYNWASMDLIDTWNTTEEVFGEINNTVSEPFEVWTGNDAHFRRTTSFSTPLILVLQMYTTENKDRIGWANVFNDFLFYEDLDQDGIYSIGDRSDMGSSPNLATSDEFRGFMIPLAQNTHVDGLDPEGIDWSDRTPYDRLVDQIAATIDFTPPTTTNGNDISWSIEYPDFPIDGYTIDDDKPTEEWWYCAPNALYEDTSPGTFTYSFDYAINETEADLDFTLEMSQLSDSQFYSAVEDYGLCLPHYNYFISSFDIKEKDQKELTVPSNTFSFESNESIVAAINMMKKDEYTLYDYPKASENTVIQAEGASVNPLVMGAAELEGNSGNYFVNLIYGIADLANADPNFPIQSDLYNLQTTNYPVWSGKRFTHDPTLSINYINYTSYIGPSLEAPDIPGYDIAITLAVVMVVTIFYIEIKHKRKIPN